MKQREERTMAQVAARLRETSPEATLEIMELYLAIREIAVNSRHIEVGLREVAAEAATLAAGAPRPNGERLRNLALHAAVLSSAAESTARALSELRAGVEGWGVSAQ